MSKLNKKTLDAIEEGLKDAKAGRTISAKQLQRNEQDKAEGKKYDGGKPGMHLLPYFPLQEMARILDYGARKYDAHNWRRGIHYSRLIAATLRHLGQFTEGVDKDEESGLSHVAHAAVNLVFLLEMIRSRSELDDRYKP